MKTLYSIFDSVAGYYCPIFIAENDTHATRMMEQSIDLNHKSDYSLWKLGTFNPDTGDLKELTPVQVINGKSLQGPKT